MIDSYISDCFIRKLCVQGLGHNHYQKAVTVKESSEATQLSWDSRHGSWRKARFRQLESPPSLKLSKSCDDTASIPGSLAGPADVIH